MKQTFNKAVVVTTAVIAIIIAITIYLTLGLSHKPTFNYVAAKRADITQGVSVAGMVNPTADLALSFQKSGTVAQVNVKVGDSVKQGTVLLKLDTKDVAAAIAQATAAVSAAQANHEKVLDGDTSADIDVGQAAVNAAQAALDNATSQQQVLVANARSAMLNAGLAAIPAIGNSSTGTITVSGDYAGDPGQYVLALSQTGNGLQFSVTGLDTGTGYVNKGTPLALGSRGLFVTFSSTGTFDGPDTWTISIPNTQSATYLTDYNAYQSALQTQTSVVSAAQLALTQAQANLTLKQTPARPEDIATANAQVQAAQAQLQAAQNAYAESIITAPIDGVVTSIDVKLGETAAPGQEAIKFISNQNFLVQAYLPESDIGKIKVGDQATVTLDAYGADVPFVAQVLAIDPAATIDQGVSTYKVTLQFNQADDRIKSGMVANVAITDATDQNALVIPQSSVISQGNQNFVLVRAGNKLAQVAITTGFSDLSGNIEVLSGLSEGDQVAAFGSQ